ncbi:flavin reductase family protein [Mangrovicoccus ximenensis]|uniref:flavin reductase family protein n=1 Tax=Mangrovicoccus ximenensis TaxID=1911570 RepID=UPI00191BECC6|nr:flavin reductase [Mangrovicoccus ximenensis]
MIPRPIALAATLSADGVPNAGAFGFFNILTHDPAIIAVGIECKTDDSPKDTGRDILDTGEFTIHIADHAMVDELEVCSVKFAPDETARRPRRMRAAAAFECRLVQSL